jgi:hypothetical protein
MKEAMLNSLLVSFCYIHSCANLTLILMDDVCFVVWLVREGGRIPPRIPHVLLSTIQYCINLKSDKFADTADS